MELESSDLFLTSPPGGSDRHSSLRTTDLGKEEESIRETEEKDEWSRGGGGGLPHSNTELPCRKATSEGRPRVTVAEAQGTGGGRRVEKQARAVLHGLVMPLRTLVLILRALGSRWCF